jgi:hypothetical protein
MQRIDGMIRRRILVNYRADPALIDRRLPPPFHVQTVSGYAMLGVCLIRIEGVRPVGRPVPVAMASDNAAYRVAVEWTEHGERRTGVYIPRRDTSSAMQRYLGGLVFPGEYGRARFSVVDDAGSSARIEVRVRSLDHEADVDLVAHEATTFGPTTCFEALEDASAFFESGRVGYSPRRSTSRLDGLRLDAAAWQVRPLDIESARTTYLPTWSGLPASALELDNALLMRNVAHTWQALDPLAPANELRPSVTAA